MFSIQRFIFFILGLLLLFTGCKTPKLEVYNRHHRPGLYVDLQVGFKNQNQLNDGSKDSKRHDYKSMKKQPNKPVYAKLKNNKSPLPYAPVNKNRQTDYRYPANNTNSGGRETGLKPRKPIFTSGGLGVNHKMLPVLSNDNDKEKERKNEPFGIIGLITALAGGGMIGAAFLETSLALGILGFLIFGLGQVFAIVSLVRIGENEDKYKGLFFGIATIGLTLLVLLGAYFGLIITAFYVI